MRHEADDILMPLAITVIVDHKVRAVEQTEFVNQGRGLFEFFGHPVPEADELLAWFVSTEDDLKDQLWDKGGNTLVLKALTKFTDQADREAVFDAMMAISLSDNEFVAEESRLMKSAASLYGFRRPPVKIDKP